MERTQIEETVNEIVLKQDYIDEDAMNEKASLKDDLFLDSLDIVEVIMDVERAFDISLSDKESARIKTLGDIYDIVKEKVNGTKQ